MKTFNSSIPGFMLLSIVLTGCNITGGAIWGEDKAADDAAISTYHSEPCDLFTSDATVGTGDCSAPYADQVLSETDGDNGDVVFYLRQLHDGNFPVIQTLKFEATEQGIVGGDPYETKYDIAFNCTAETDTPDHLRPYHCVAQAAPRLRSNAQPGGGVVKLRTVTFENPSCHATVAYKAYAAYCNPSSGRGTPIKSPVLGLVKP